MRHAYFLLLAALLMPAWAWATGVRGRVLTSDGTPLPFTTIYVKQTGSGSVTGEGGLYELRLPQGAYTIVFQHLGYQTQELTVVVADGWTTRDVVMLSQTYILAQAEVKGGMEDPAYKIIRKAIAKAGFHRQQLNGYTCEVYLKGGGRVVSAPWVFRKAMEKEGLDTSATFISETVTRITYKRPGQFTEEVVSIRTSGDSRDSSPMRFIGASFYEPLVAESIISPLSPKAFAYYKFRYVTTFADRQYQVSKIEVIPRSKGEDVVAGYLYIVDDLWCIHSFDFSMVIQGIGLKMKQVFAPVEPDIWLPVTHRYDGEGKILGVRFEFGYLAAVSNYAIQRNPDIATEIVVYDDKTEQHLIEERKGAAATARQKEALLEQGEELTQKELRKLMRDYEREERRRFTEPEVVSMRKLTIDSLAYKSDSAYWAERRPIPLTSRELRGYVLQDSLSEEARKKELGDTLSGNENRFKPGHLIVGFQYKLSEKDFLRVHPAWTKVNFNTVDGWNAEYRLSYYRRMDPHHRIEISPLVRYAFARNRFNGTLLTEYRYRNGLKRGAISAEGGWYYAQFNREQPILPVFNTFSTLFIERNFMKVYDRNFAELRWRHSFNGFWSAGARLAFDERLETFNNTRQVWFPSRRIYTPNLPKNPTIAAEGFGNSRSLQTTLYTEWKPGARYTRSDERYYMRNSPPVVGLRYTKAIPDVWGTTPDIDFAAVSAKFDFKFTTLGRLNLRSEYGRFFRFTSGDFMDYAHFMGNETYFTRLGTLNGYSLLPYYEFSTSRHYVSTYGIYEFRNFILGNIRTLRMLGVNERVIANHLYTPRNGHYFEVGYSITNLYRFIRIDFVTSYQDGGFRDWRIQVGFSSDVISVQ